MLYALIDGLKSEASPKKYGICPLCERPVFSKCGEINIWHWAHQVDESCDSWYEPETEWHKNWKLVFGKDNSEIVIKKDNTRHIADIYTNDLVVIELQNSPIQKEVIRVRENFYGERMIWVLNGIPFKQNFSIRISPLENRAEYYWGIHYIKTTSGTIVDKRTGNTVYKPTNERDFFWSWPRKTWEEVKMHLFIDFGDQYLFKVTEGMGTKSGKGKLISKVDFIRKYGGDTELLHLLIEKESNSNS